MHLTEVLLAAGLLATALASLPAAFTSAVRANLAAADATWTVVLAAQKMEELRSRPFPEAGIDFSFELLDGQGRVINLPLEGAAYLRTWRAEPMPSAPDETVVITVVVSPYSLARPEDVATPGATRLVTLRTRKAA